MALLVLMLVRHLSTGVTEPDALTTELVGIAVHTLEQRGMAARMHLEQSVRRRLIRCQCVLGGAVPLSHPLRAELLELRWFLVGSWLVPGWFLVGSWLVPGWFLVGFLLVPGWFLVGSWLVSGWFLAGFWLVAGWFLVGSWMVPGWFLVGFWLVSGWFLVGFWLVPGWFLVGF